ncbi:MAG: cation diffusion facilitator family transporter, partial [Pseudomonadota bacterium]|nr:cation diffusion facilitator family transporter [Pseudomonadota bacterium]
MTDSSPQNRYVAMRNVTLIGVIGNILLAIIKVMLGILGRSQALIADGLHSLSDLISDGVVLLASKYSNQEADEEHPYGHARFETLATVVVGALLVMLAIGMFIDATRRLLMPELLLQPTYLSLIAALLSIFIKEWLYQYTVYVAKQVRSQMLRANAWHHRSDAISSIIVFIGIAGTLIGFPWLDALAAMGVSLMIAHIGWSLGKPCVNELLDHGLENNRIREIETIILSVNGVHSLHKLRSRYMGEQALMDVHIVVDPYISVLEGHDIGETVRQRLINE